MKQILQYLFNHNTLSKAEAKAILIEIAQNKFNENEVTSFVTVFLMRSITLEELEGFREALLALSLPVELQKDDLLDIVGTGGDGKNTFNISTLASFVAVSYTHLDVYKRQQVQELLLNPPQKVNCRK